MDSVHSHKSWYIKQPFSSMIVRGSGLYLGFPILFTHLLFIFLYMKIPTLKKHKAPNHLSDIICLGHHIIFFLTKKNLLQKQLESDSFSQSLLDVRTAFVLYIFSPIHPLLLYIQSYSIPHD